MKSCVCPRIWLYVAISIAVIGLSRLGAAEATSKAPGESKLPSAHPTLKISGITGVPHEWGVLKRLTISKIDGTPLSPALDFNQSKPLDLAPGKRRLKICIDHAENQRVDGSLTLPADEGHIYVLTAFLRKGLYHIFVYDQVTAMEARQVVHKTIAAPYGGLQEYWSGPLPGRIMGPPGTGTPVQERMLPRTRW